MAEAHFQAFVPDFDYYRRLVACQFACPVGTDARGYVNAIARGEYERAYLIAREVNPFASTCGWVCGAPCEAACRRGKIDAPIAIRALKRFVNDRYGVYIGQDRSPLPLPWRDQPPSVQTYPGPGPAFDLGNSTFPHSLNQLRGAAYRGERTGKRVAVVGSGPAGLTCAHDLALLGHEVVIFEAASLPGGMLRLGVPEYRLPRDLIDLEIASVLALGPELRLNQALGRDFSLADLRRDASEPPTVAGQGFDAVFLAIGTYRSRKLNVEGEELDGVLRAVDFLLNVNLGGYNLDLGRKVLVIGGGNVAMDVARTALRVGQPMAESGGDIALALDVARAAVRLGATEEVHCLVVEDRHEMLADPLEVAEAEDEGVIIHNHLAPRRIVGQAGGAGAVETLDVARAFDEQGRFNPQLIPNTEKAWECDSVIVAIGQMGELAWVKPEDGLEVTRGGTLKVDRETLMTTAEGVFAGGDIAFGPRLIINAVADGQRAARNIHRWLQQVEPRTVRQGWMTPIPLHEYPTHGPAAGYLRLPRQLPPTLPVERRIGVAQVELGYPEEEARRQGERCLVCSLNPVFNGDLCIMCNGCVDVCPTDCLKLVPLSQVAGDETLASVVEARLGFSLAAFWQEEVPSATAMLFDPTHCIRCSLCAQRCPTGAITMEAFRFAEKVVFE
ncbi:MAG: FAD-dependent oxidoreductase [Anaerolineae bacterium]|nr:FAD-dependent oxidoreductase [Anaerolineae bacterium]